MLSDRLRPDSILRAMADGTDSTGSLIRVHAFVEGLDIGGAESLLAEFAEAAKPAGIDFTVGCLRRYSGVSAERLRQLGIEPAILDVTDLKPNTFQRVRRQFSALSPDLVHTHLRDASMLGCAAARSLGIPSVTTIHHTSWGGPRKERFRDALTALSVRLCAARVIGVSEAARAAYLAHNWERPDRVVVIHNGIADRRDSSSGAAVRAELGIATDELVVSMISGLRPEKAHDVALAAVGQLARRIPGVRLVIAGDGPERVRIAEAAAPLETRVILTGYRTDVMALLEASDVVLHPSHHEALPTTLIEAAAAGVPSLATDVGGVSEIVIDGVTGILVGSPPRADDLERALEALLLDRDLRAQLGRAARARFESEFRVERWVERTRAIYDEVLAKSRAAAVRSASR
jgi:glycosyltransferase involved in cell wall biosynthesis